MRKITSLAVRSFEDRKAFNLSNTSVEVQDGTVTLKLFGNAIAGTDYKGMWITDAGWESRTTFERLNGFDGVRVNMKKGQMYLNGQAWDGSKTYIKTTEFFLD